MSIATEGHQEKGSDSKSFKKNHKKVEYDRPGRGERSPEQDYCC